MCSRLAWRSRPACNSAGTAVSTPPLATVAVASKLGSRSASRPRLAATRPPTSRAARPIAAAASRRLRPALSTLPGGLPAAGSAGIPAPLAPSAPPDSRPAPAASGTSAAKFPAGSERPAPAAASAPTARPLSRCAAIPGSKPSRLYWRSVSKHSSNSRATPRKLAPPCSSSAARASTAGSSIPCRRRGWRGRPKLDSPSRCIRSRARVTVRALIPSACANSAAVAMRWLGSGGQLSVRQLQQLQRGGTMMVQGA